MIARGLASVTVTDSRAALSLQDGSRLPQTSIPLTRLPEASIRWQLEARRALFSSHARQLFEYDSFHIEQPAYPSGYVFWVGEVFDKSPLAGGGRRIA